MRMRGWIAGAVVLVGMQGTVLAQGEFGVKAGASFGNISNKGLLPGNLKTRTGYAAGLYLGSGGMLGIGAEGLYAQRGVESGTGSSESQLDFVDLPVYLKVRIPTPGIRPFIYAGPQGSYEVRCRTADGGDCAPYSSSDRKRLTWAAVIGAGVRIGGSLGVGIEGRYLYGLTDLRISTVTSSSSYKDRSFLLLASIGR